VKIENPQLRSYIQDGYRQVEGWLQLPVLWALSRVAGFQSAQKIVGASCEIGVHHGRFLLAIENVTPAGQKCYGVDIFDSQHLNIDSSGKGSHQIFTENAAQYAAEPDRIETRHLDSTSAAAQGFFRSIEGQVSLFSVDGGHSRAHTVSDLMAAETCLCEGGVAFLDDLFNVDWPGVTEGLIDYLRGPSRLVPVASVGGKMMLCGLSDTKPYAAMIRKAAVDDEEMRPKAVKICGTEYFSIRHMPKKT
jgi:hypothetical protein